MSDLALFDSVIECSKTNLLFWFILYGSAYVYFTFLYQEYWTPRKFTIGHSTDLLAQELFLSFCGIMIVSTMEAWMLQSNNSLIDKRFSLYNVFIEEESWSEFMKILIFQGLHIRTVLFTLFEDFEFYFYHRICHKIQFLWKYVHKTHHESRDINVFSGLSFHPIEHLMYFGPVLICCFVYTPQWIFSIFKFNLIWGPILGHCGHHVNTHKGFVHYIHHNQFNYNYGSGLTEIWDWIGGTQYHLTEEQHFKKYPKNKKG
eukprot:444662_1